MANMYQFTAGGGTHSYTYPPAQQPPYGAYQQYSQNPQTGTYSQQLQYQGQNQNYGAPQGYQPPSSQTYQPPAPLGYQPPNPQGPQSTPYPAPPSYQFQPGGIPNAASPQAPYPLSASPSQYGANPHTALHQQRKHSAPQPETQACYNCGGLDHFAQNCPEPRRAVPAGSLVPRPPKRQKTGGPVITRYPPPPGYQQPPQRGHTFPQVSRHEPLAMSSTFTSQNQPWGNWQGSHQPVYKPPNLPPQPPINGQWNSQNFSGPASHNVQSPSPITANGSNNWQGYMPTPPGQQGSPTGPVFAYPSNPSSSNHSAAPTPGGPPVPTLQQSSTIANEDVDLIDTIKAAEPRLEPWLQELKELDDAFDKQKRGGGPTVSHPPNPVGQPLASTMALADAIGRLPIAASLAPGVPVSLYFRDLTDKELETNIRDSATWSVVKDDTLFADIESNCDLVRIEELVELREEMTGALMDEDEEAEVMQVDDRDSGSGRSDSEDHDDDRYSENGESSVREGSSAGDYTDAERDERDDRNSVSPRAVTRKEMDNADDRSYHGRKESVSRERLEKRRSLSPGRVNPRSDRHGRAQHRDNMYRDHRGGRDNRQAFQRRHSRERQHSRQRRRSPHVDPKRRRNDRRRRSWDRQTPPAPPPPPPPPPRHRYYDGADEHTPPKNAANDDSVVPNGAGVSLNNEEDFIDDPANLSPAWGNDEGETEQESIDRSCRAPSEESNGGPRRQEDPSSASKKRQPHVAAAYGRRW